MWGHSSSSCPSPNGPATISKFLSVKRATEGIAERAERAERKIERKIERKTERKIERKRERR